MTPEDAFGRRPAQSPGTIRNHSFSIRRRGFDPAEVTEFLGDLAEQVEYADADRAALRAELERVRIRSSDEEERAHITAHAVGLLSQAQQIADDLVAEAEQYARDLVDAARDQHRDVLKRAHDSLESAVRAAEGPLPPTAELEYVRTFTQVAHVQLRSVLDALAEQVERLGQMPEVPKPPDPAVGEIEWWTDLSKN